MLSCSLWFGSTGLTFPANTCAEVVSERSPLKENLDQQSWVQSEARKSQEKHRVRIELPRAAINLPTGGPGLSRSGQELKIQEPERAGFPGSPLVMGVLLLLVCAGLIPLLAPGWIRRINGRQAQTEPLLDTIAEGKAFTDFLVSFRVGPICGANHQIHSAGPRSAINSPSGTIQADPLSGILAASLKRLLHIRDVLRAIRREQDSTAQRRLLQDLQANLHDLTNHLSLPQLLPVWQVASVTEGLVRQLVNRPPAPNALRTVAAALDLLTDFCRRSPRPDLSTEPPIRILAVDDDLIGQHAVGLALKKAFNQPDLASNGAAALAQASLIAYDVIFLDILMPGMNGFELCAKIRQTKLNPLTPVVFVTALSDFNARARSNLCGGSDFVTKPFLTFEVTVKALVLTLRGRLARQRYDAPDHSGFSRSKAVALQEVGP